MNPALLATVAMLASFVCAAVLLASLRSVLRIRRVNTRVNRYRRRIQSFLNRNRRRMGWFAGFTVRILRRFEREILAAAASGSIGGILLKKAWISLDDPFFNPRPTIVMIVVATVCVFWIVARIKPREFIWPFVRILGGILIGTVLTIGYAMKTGYTEPGSIIIFSFFAWGCLAIIATAQPIHLRNRRETASSREAPSHI